MASLQNIVFATEPKSNVDRIRVSFQYSTDNQQSWTDHTYVIPDDMFDIDPEERQHLATELVFAIARGKGHIDREGNVL